MNHSELFIELVLQFLYFLINLLICLVDNFLSWSRLKRFNMSRMFSSGTMIICMWFSECRIIIIRVNKW
jgi:hypothetical protein